MQKRCAAAAACSFFLSVRSASALPAPILITFESLDPFLSPNSAIAGILVSTETGQFQDLL